MEKPIYTKAAGHEWVNTGTPDGEIMVFRPTKEEFANFSKYIEKIERNHRAHLSSGVCKIIPPPGWHPRPSKDPEDYSDLDEFVIENPVKETMERATSSGCYVKNNTVYRKQMRVADFKRMAFLKHFRNPKPEYDLNELERHFWRNMLHHEPVYGADTPGSIYDADVREFNMNRLGTILDLLKEQQLTIKGVNTVFLYFGMWKTMFPWHAEDMDLYSINYLHFGEPKFWYAIPSQAAEKFERLAAQHFPDGLHICKAFLRHKVYVISPSVLKTHGIPFGTMVQYPGEFMITFPRGYHMGFNLGYNCAESTNFALERWIDYGKNAVVCYCRNDCVEIDMRPFMKKYRPQEYKEWLDYWYGDRPTACKPSRRQSDRFKRKSSKGFTDSSSEDGAIGPVIRCTKRQKAIFKARKPLRELWANQPVNLFAERQHNARCGKLYPHCAVCQYFVRRDTWTRGTSVQALPEKSKRFVSDQMFDKESRLEQQQPGGADDNNWRLQEDTLLECANCSVVVHTRCYPSRAGNAAQQKWMGEEAQNGGDERNGDGQQNGEGQTGGPSNCSATAKETAEAENGNCEMGRGENWDGGGKSDKWLCDRCYQRDDISIRHTSCTLCELRGGALLKTSERDPSGPGFMHVICALMDPGTRFLQPDARRSPLRSPARRWLASQSQDERELGGSVGGEHRYGSDCINLEQTCSENIAAVMGTTLPQCPPSRFNLSCGTNTPVVPSAGCSNLLLYDSGIVESPDDQVFDDSQLSTSHHSNQASSPSQFADLCPLPQSSPLALPPPSLANKFLQRTFSCASIDSIGSSSSSQPPLLSPNSLVDGYCWPALYSASASPNPGFGMSPNAATCAGGGAQTPDRSSRTPSVSNSNLLSEYPACYQCEVCCQQSEHLIRCDICVDERETSAAKLRFHVTCAPLADVTFERRDFPGALTVCEFHHSGQTKTEEENASHLEEQRPFELKQRVVVDLSESEWCEEEKQEMEGAGEDEEKRKEKWIGYGLIYAIHEHLLATVDFMDGTSSSDVFPDDIFDCECKHFGCNGSQSSGKHHPGSLVYINWNDDQPYMAYYRDQSAQKRFRIKLFPPLSFEVKDRRRRARQKAEEAWEQSVKNKNSEEVKDKEKKRDDEVELTSDQIYRRDELHPEHVRKALLKRKSIELNTSNKQRGMMGGGTAGR